MRRLPAIGIAVAFVTTLAVSAVATADPIKIEVAAQVQRDVRLTPLGTPAGLSYFAGRQKAAGHRDAGGEFTSSAGGSGRHHGSGDIPRGNAFTAMGHSWSDAGVPMASSFVSPSSGKVVPFDAVATAASDNRSANASGNGSLLPPQLPAAGAVPAAAAANAVPPPGTTLLLPTALAGDFGSAAVAGAGSAASVVTPEPASMVLFGSGLLFAGLGARLRRRRK